MKIYHVENVIDGEIHLAIAQVHVLHHEFVLVLLVRIVNKRLKENFETKQQQQQKQ